MQAAVKYMGAQEIYVESQKHAEGFYLESGFSVTSEEFMEKTHRPGGSCVVDPYGHYMSEPVWDKEEIIYEELDMQKVAAAKMEFDPIGHYARNDVLKLNVIE